MPQVPAVIPVVSDPRLKEIEASQQPVPRDWASRTLYLGAGGADHWLQVAHEANYPLAGGDTFHVRRNRLAALAELRPNTFVSLGPGDGAQDIELVTLLQASNPDLHYIPVEISSGLLERATRLLQPHVPVPIAILGDFEGGQDFLAEILKHRARPPVLFSLVGERLGTSTWELTTSSRGFDGFSAPRTFSSWTSPSPGRPGGRRTSLGFRSAPIRTPCGAFWAVPCLE